MTDAALLQNLEREPLFQFHPSGAKNRSNRSRRSALLSDDFSEVALCNSELKNCCLFPFDWAHRHLIRIVYKSFRNLLDQLLHSHVHTRFNLHNSRRACELEMG
jgi:hypothetical protein